MATFKAFFRKELIGQIRTCKILILSLIFVALGVMNPAIAKITPWLFEILSDTLEGSGINLTQVTVSAMDSWVQFFKNIPMGLIAFILLESNVFTKEYSSGTLILSLTKGLSRHKVVVSKASVLAILWTVGFWLCFIITYAFNAYFWDNSIVENLIFSGFCWWLFGVLTLALTVFFSTLFSSNIAVLGGVSAVVFTSYIIGMLPKIGKYLPTALTDSYSLIYGFTAPKDYLPSLVIAATAIIACFAVSIPVFNRKTL